MLSKTKWPLFPQGPTTPPQFYKDGGLIGPLNGTFIMVMNDPRRPYNKTYEVEFDRHTYDGHNWKYLNLPMSDIENLAMASIRMDAKCTVLMMWANGSTAKRGYLDTENYDYGSLLVLHLV